MPSRPEYLFPKTTIMMSFRYAPKDDRKRFMGIVNSRIKKNKRIGAKK